MEEGAIIAPTFPALMPQSAARPIRVGAKAGIIRPPPQITQKGRAACSASAPPRPNR